jgi:hypothetical protein
MGNRSRRGQPDGQRPAIRRRRLAFAPALLLTAGVAIAITLGTRLPAPPAGLATGSDARRHTASKRARMVALAALRHLHFRSDGHPFSASAAPALRGERGAGSPLTMLKVRWPRWWRERGHGFRQRFRFALARSWNGARRLGDEAPPRCYARRVQSSA